MQPVNDRPTAHAPAADIDAAMARVLQAEQAARAAVARAQAEADAIAEAARAEQRALAERTRRRAQRVREAFARRLQAELGVLAAETHAADQPAPPSPATAAALDRALARLAAALTEPAA